MERTIRLKMDIKEYKARKLDTHNAYINAGFDLIKTKYHNGWLIRKYIKVKKYLKIIKNRSETRNKIKELDKEQTTLEDFK